MPTLKTNNILYLVLVALAFKNALATDVEVKAVNNSYEIPSSIIDKGLDLLSNSAKNLSKNNKGIDRLIFSSSSNLDPKNFDEVKYDKVKYDKASKQLTRMYSRSLQKEFKQDSERLNSYLDRYKFTINIQSFFGKNSHVNRDNIVYDLVAKEIKSNEEAESLAALRTEDFGGAGHNTVVWDIEPIEKQTTKKILSNPRPEEEGVLDLSMRLRVQEGSPLVILKQDLGFYELRASEASVSHTFSLPISGVSSINYSKNNSELGDAIILRNLIEIKDTLLDVNYNPEHNIYGSKLGYKKDSTEFSFGFSSSLKRSFQDSSNINMGLSLDF